MVCLFFVCLIFLAVLLLFGSLFLMNYDGVIDIPNVIQNSWLLHVIHPFFIDDKLENMLTLKKIKNIKSNIYNFSYFYLRVEVLCGTLHSRPLA